MTSQGFAMHPIKKNGKAMSRPLPGLAPANTSSTESVGRKKDKISVMASNGAKISSDKVEKSKKPFRFRWQKKGGFAYQDILMENADTPGDKKVKRGVTAKKSDYDDEDGDESGSGDDTTVHQYTGGKTMLHGGYDNSGGEESDVELKQEDSDDDYESGGTTASKRPIGAAPRNNQFNQEYKMKKQEPKPNGRVKGRKLVMWHRPRMIEKLLLHLQYECHRGGLKLPWDKVVERLSTGSSGASALQHINKMRDVLITEGHMVPPLLGKRSVPQDLTVRGYIRDLDSNKPTDTKVIRWGDFVEDRKENLEVDGVVRGSGNYRRATSETYQRGLNKALVDKQKATGLRRNRLPAEFRKDAAVAPKMEVKKEKKVASASSSRSASIDPAELSSDDEYDPSAAKPSTKYGRRSRAKPRSKYNVDSEDSEDDEFDNEVDEPVRRAVAVNTPQDKRVRVLAKAQGVQGLLTPPSSRLSKIVALHIGQDALKRFADTGKSVTGVKKNAVMQDAPSGNDLEDGLEIGSHHGADVLTDAEAFGEYGTTIQYAQTSSHLLAQDVVGQTGYQGMIVHGTKAQYQQAIQDGLDPKTNGIKYKQAAGLLVGENGVSYTLPPPPAYLGSGVRKSPLLAGTSAGAFSTFGSPNGNTMTALNFGSYHETPDFMNGYGGQNNASINYGAADHTMTDSFFPGLSHYTSGSDIFGVGSTTFNTTGLPLMSYDTFRGQTGFDMGLDENVSFNTTNSYAATPTSSASGFQVAANNTASTTPINVDNQDDTVSLGAPTPPHYPQYAPQGDEANKENDAWLEY